MTTPIDRLRPYLQSQPLSHVEVAAGLSSGVLTRWLKGERAGRRPSYERVCGALGLPVEWIYDGDEAFRPRNAPVLMLQTDTSLRVERRRISARYPLVAELEHITSKRDGVTEEVLDIAIASLGQHKGNGPTEVDFVDALRRAQKRVAAYDNALGARLATDEDLGDEDL